VTTARAGSRRTQQLGVGGTVRHPECEGGTVARPGTAIAWSAPGRAMRSRSATPAQEATQAWSSTIRTGRSTAARTCWLDRRSCGITRARATPSGEPARTRCPADRQGPARQAGGVRLRNSGRRQRRRRRARPHPWAGQSPDAPQLAPAVERVKRRAGRKPRTVTADRGYGEKSVEDDLREAGVRSLSSRARASEQGPTSPGTKAGVPQDSGGEPAEGRISSGQTRLRLGPYPPGRHRWSPDLDRTGGPGPPPGQDRSPGRTIKPHLKINNPGPSARRPRITSQGLQVEVVTPLHGDRDRSPAAQASPGYSAALPADSFECAGVSATHTVLMLQNSRIPCAASSRPCPEALMPPNGSAM
jgi:hypothetical protein